MSSLAEVSNLLVEQNSVLALQANATMNTNKEIKKLTNYFTGLDSLEDRREASPAISAPSEPITGGGDSGGGGGIQLGALLSPGALLGIAKTIALRLLKAGAFVFFADEIAEALGNFFGTQEFKDEIERAIVGLGIGSLFGLKFGLIGAAIGAVLDEDTLGKITPVIADIQVKLEEFAKEYLPSIETIRAGLVSGLEGIRALLTGDWTTLFGTEGQDGKILETLGLVAGLGLLLMPSKFFGALYAGGKLVGGLSKWGSKKMLDGFKALGGLATSIISSSASAATAADGFADVGRDAKNRGSKKPGVFSKIVDFGKRNVGKVAGGAVGAASAIGGVLSAPVLLGIAAVALTAIGGFGIYILLGLKKPEDDTVEGMGQRSLNEGAVTMEELTGTSSPHSNVLARGNSAALAYEDSVQEFNRARELERFGRRQAQMSSNIVNAPTDASTTVGTIDNSSTTIGTSGPSVDLSDLATASPHSR